MGIFDKFDLPLTPSFKRRGKFYSDFVSSKKAPSF